MRGKSAHSAVPFYIRKGGNDQNVPLRLELGRAAFVYRITIGRELQIDQVRSDRHASPAPQYVY